MSSPTATTNPTNGAPSRSWAGGKPGGPSRLMRVSGRRRRVPYLVLGVLLVVICTVGAVVAVLQVGHRAPVLSLARPVTVGQVLGAQDVRQVPLSADSGADVVPASQMSAVVGQPVAFSLPAGTLLPRSALGRPQVPPPGQAVVAVAAKPGQYPPQVAAGTAVTVLAVPGSSTSSTGTANATPGGSWSAVVTSVGAPGSDQSTVVQLQLSAANARQVAAIPPGQAALVAVPAGGGQ